MSEKPYPSETPLLTPYDEPLATERPERGRLILIATPIGNMSDISARAIENLSHADIILCEDTRVTGKLLLAHNIKTPTRTLHDHNEQDRIPFLIDALQDGKQFVLVSDAGTPLVSDPGYRLVRAAIAAGIQVVSVPGPNAVITALTLSGLPPLPFMFLGFPPRTEARLRAFENLRASEQAGLHSTLIWYEAPHRLIGTLRDLIAVFGTEREAAVGRELTKRFEETVRGTLGEILSHFESHAPRGEITLLIGPPSKNDSGADDLDRHLLKALETHSVKDAAALVAGFVKLPKRTIYARALEISRGH